MTMTMKILMKLKMTDDEIKAKFIQSPCILNGTSISATIQSGSCLTLFTIETILIQNIATTIRKQQFPIS